MTTTLVLSFPFGRYHATPWGRHVNEGAVELPPSPWRLLRALYATWRNRAPDLDPHLVHQLLRQLALPPEFYIAPHSLGHTRHYYPDSAHRSGKSSTDSTFDAFAAVAEITVRWKATVHGDHLVALEKLAGALPYFGRADSICDARVDPTWKPRHHDVWAPLDVIDEIDPHAEVATVLAPALAFDPDSLLARPIDLRRANLLFPPGTRLLGYARSAPSSPPQLSPPSAATVTAVRFDILQAALPPAGDALVYTDLLRQAAIKQTGKRPEGTLLGGRDAEHRPMRGHGHAHYLPLINADRKVTGLLVWVPAGLPEQELTGVLNVKRLAGYAGRLTVRVAGYGTLNDVAPELTGPATRWVSSTPHIPSRYAKHGYTDDVLTADITRELSARRPELPAIVAVERTDGDQAAFRRHRPSARNRDNRTHGHTSKPAAFLRLTFPRPVSGPLTVGHLSHFGLGLFHPQP